MIRPVTVRPTPPRIRPWSICSSRRWRPPAWERSLTKVATDIGSSIAKAGAVFRREIAPTSGCKISGSMLARATSSCRRSIFTAPEPSVRLFLQALFSGDGSIYHSDEGVFLEYYSKSRRLIEDVHHLLLRFGIFSLIREKTTAIGTRACKIQITDKDQILRFAERIGFSPGSVKQRLLEEKVLPMIAAQPRRKSNFDSLPQEAWAIAGVAARVGGLTLNSLGIHSSRINPCRSAAARKVALRPVTRTLLRSSMDLVWDEVESIEPAGVEEVFDITVPTLHNFVANDFIVHNSTYARCGIIVNVTPLEPEWEGHVTLEFSNTTPLPAKIYANEGVAQMLFFESDEVCETSYKDRGGKYQGQRGVTLPKT